MRIRMEDGRVFEGTAKQIVEDMKSISFGHDNSTLSDYIDNSVRNALRFNEIVLDVTGDTEEEKAKSLVQEMLKKKLAEKM